MLLKVNDAVGELTRLFVLAEAPDEFTRLLDHVFRKFKNDWNIEGFIDALCLNHTRLSEDLQEPFLELVAHFRETHMH